MRNDEQGYIVVETIGAFLLFVFLIVSILSLVNIVALQARVHNAMTQAAKAMSMYSYVFEVTGIADELKAMDEQAENTRLKADELKGNINGVISGIRDLSADPMGNIGNAGSILEQGRAALDSGVELIGDPASLINMLVRDGIDKGFAELAGVLVERYLCNGAMSGREYLKSMNVESKLNFHGYINDYIDPNVSSNENSVIIDKNGNIKLTVRYDVGYSFWSLPLPFKKLSVTQSVKTKAWLGGDGKGYVKP